MKTKIIIALILLAAIMLFSMQLCTMIFGNKPVVTITYPTPNSTITGTSLTVTGTIEDLDGDASKVKVFIEDTSAVGWDYGVTSGNFDVTLTLSNFVSGKTYSIIAEGYDARGNVSEKAIVNVTYSSSSGGGGTSPNAPTLQVTQPANGTTIYTTSLTVTGTATDPNGDLNKVTAWIEGKSISNSYNSFTAGSTSAQNFSITLNLASLSNGQYTLKVQAEDNAGNKSEEKSISFTLNVGTSSNILLNGNFATYTDNYSGSYTTQALIDTYLNKTNGDYLANWQFYIWPQFALDNGIKIELNGSSVRHYSTNDDGDGNVKIMLMQYISHSVTSKTKLKIQFKINDSAGNNNESPLKIAYNGTNNGYGTTFAVYSIGSLEYPYPPNGKNYVHNLTKGATYTYEFYLNADAGIPVGTQLSNIQIWSNDHYWDLTIFSIELFEAP